MSGIPVQAIIVIAHRMIVMGKFIEKKFTFSKTTFSHATLCQIY